MLSWSILMVSKTTSRVAGMPALRSLRISRGESAAAPSRVPDLPESLPRSCSICLMGSTMGVPLGMTDANSALIFLVRPAFVLAMRMTSSESPKIQITRSTSAALTHGPAKPLSFFMCLARPSSPWRKLVSSVSSKPLQAKEALRNPGRRSSMDPSNLTSLSVGARTLIPSEACAL